MRNIEETIQAYLTDNMSDQEKTQFEIELEKDDKLRNRVSIYQVMDRVLGEEDWDLLPSNTTNPSINSYRQFFEGKDGKHVSNVIKNTENQYFNKEESSENSLTKVWYGVAAAVVLLMITVATFFAVNQDMSAQELYAYYDKDQALPSFTSRDEETILSEIENLYTISHYEEALVLVGEYSISKNEHFNPQIYLYQGSILLKLNQDKQALEVFEKLLLSNSLDAFKSHWYMALAHLKMDNKEKAKEEIQKLLESPQKFKHNEALELFKKLD